MSDFLLEIGLEEIPARMIAGAEAELGRRVNDLLTRERLLGAGGQADHLLHAAPSGRAGRGRACQPGRHRRAADRPVVEGGLQRRRADRRLPRPLRRRPVCPVAALEKVTNAKGEYVGATVKRLGLAAPQVLAAELPKEVLALYWAKNMYWRAGKPERFVRPIRWVVALLDSAVVPFEIAGITAGNTSRGHRILHGAHSVGLDLSEELR